jgi:glucose/arabinose dehydrogenase
VFALVVMAGLLGACAPASTGGARVTGTPLPEIPATLPLSTEVAIDGLDLPTNVEFAPDGRVFVAEKSGVVRTWDSITDPTSTVTADLRSTVRNVGDQGLLGLAVDPGWPSRPFGATGAPARGRATGWTDA